MTQIKGAIDNFKGTQLLGGWARCQDTQAEAPLHVRAYYDDRLVGETEANLPRADVGGNYGFNIQLRTSVEADDIRSERFIITASASDGAFKKLTFFLPMVENLELFCLGRKISETGDGGVRHLIAGLTTSSRPLLKAVKEAVERLDTSGMTKFVGRTESKELSMFGLRLGLKSPDGTSVVGRNGTMFVLAGTNQVIDQYAQREDDPTVQSQAKCWLSLFQVRQKRISMLGSKYI